MDKTEIFPPSLSVLLTSRIFLIIFLGAALWSDRYSPNGMQFKRMGEEIQFLVADDWLINTASILADQQDCVVLSGHRLWTGKQQQIDHVAWICGSNQPNANARLLFIDKLPLIKLIFN